MKKVLFFLLTLLLPFFLFLELWGSYRYNMLQNEISALESEQQDWIEKNKKVISDIAEYNSPARIQSIAEDELGLVEKENADKTRIELESGSRP